MLATVTFMYVVVPPRFIVSTLQNTTRYFITTDRDLRIVVCFVVNSVKFAADVAVDILVADIAVVRIAMEVIN